MQAPALTFRKIDPYHDGHLAYRHFVETSRLSFGPNAQSLSRANHLRWLRSRIEEFPEGHVLAYLGDELVGQLELEVPYGKTRGYVNLFYVAKPFRGQGFGRRLHEFAERYFRSWEAERIALDVSPDNEKAVGFYKHLGYRFTQISGETARVWRMEKAIIPCVSNS